MRQKSLSKSDPAKRAVRDIRRKTRKQYSVEEKIRIVVSGLRDVKEAARDHVRAHRESAPFLQSRRDHKKVETWFGDLKSNLGLTRLRLRGLSRAP
jgi:hypothetical protein